MRTDRRVSLGCTSNKLLFATVSCLGTVLSSGVASAQGDLPPTVKVLLEEAEEDYFDGNFDGASRRIDEAYKWVLANKLEMARNAIDHSTVELMVAGLQAEIFHAQGEPLKARGRLAHAMTVLKSRRQAYTKRGFFPESLWQYEAFLKFIEGDLERPMPDFGLANDPLVPAEIRQFLLQKGDPSRSIRAFMNADAVMGKPMAQQGGDRYRTHRLRGRLFTSLAWIRVLKAGSPSKDEVADAAAFLDRAEEAFARNDFWKQCIHHEQFGQIPATFKDIEKHANGELEKLDLKRIFAQTIQDWLAMQLLRVELTAFQEDADPQAFDDLMATTEQRYDRIVGFLKSQYGAVHPRSQSVRLSRARWLLSAARNGEKKPEARRSMLMDCLLELEGVKRLASDEMMQKSTVELAARLALLNMDQQQPFMQAADRETFVKRVDELRELITEEVERRSAPNRRPKPQAGGNGGDQGADFGGSDE